MSQTPTDETPEDENEEWTECSIGVALGNSLQIPNTVKISFDPYGRPEYGSAEPKHNQYRYIKGELNGIEGYAHIKDENTGEWFILARGEEFAPSPEEWYGEEVLEKLDYPEELGSPPLADQQYVVGVRAKDSNGYIPIGINPVILYRDLATTSSSSAAKQDKPEYQQHITEARSALLEIEDKDTNETIKSLDSGIQHLIEAKRLVDQARDQPTTPEDCHTENPNLRHGEK